MSAETELAWAAGFFDGEGTVSQTTASGTTRRYLLIRMAQTDPRPLERFVAAVGVGHVRGPYEQKKSGGKWSDYWVWQVAGTKAYQVLRTLWPYMAEPKKEQYDRVLPKVV